MYQVEVITSNYSTGLSKDINSFLETFTVEELIDIKVTVSSYTASNGEYNGKQLNQKYTAVVIFKCN